MVYIFRILPGRASKTAEKQELTASGCATGDSDGTDGAEIPVPRFFEEYLQYVGLSMREPIVVNPSGADE